MPSNEEPKPVSAIEKKALSAAAREIVQSKPSIRALLPKPQFTRADESVSHYLSDADLVQLEHCERRSLSPYVELAWGAVIGNLIPTVSAIQKIWKAEPGKSGQTLDAPEFATLAMMLAFLVIGTVFTMVSSGSKESISSIIAEIKRRPRSEPD